MRKEIRVFNHDKNPATESPNFFITRAEADRRVNRQYAYYLSPDAIQHRPPAAWTRDESQLMISGLFHEAWSPRWSENFIVWQMHTQAA